MSGVREGCIQVTFACESKESLQFLSDLNDSLKLERMLNEVLRSLLVVISNKRYDGPKPVVDRRFSSLLDDRTIYNEVFCAKVYTLGSLIKQEEV